MIWYVKRLVKNALARVSKFISKKKVRVMRKAFKMSQFSYFGMGVP